MMKTCFASLVVIALSVRLFAQQSPAVGPDGRHDRIPLQPGGGTLHSHNVCSATSKDGLAWIRDDGVRMSSASVPCAINDGDRRVLIYFVQPPNQPGKPETVACAVSTDGMQFEQADGFQIEGLSTLKAVDPSILRDDSGKFRLYYLASDHRGDPAAAPGPHAIHLALSIDGIRFQEKGAVFHHEDLVDPDVFRFKDRWFMYVFAKRATIIATSDDGEQFAYAQDMEPANWGTTAPVHLPDGRLRLYAFEQRVPSANAVRSFLSSDGINWAPETGDRLKAGADEQITDPFVVTWRGGYKMYFKSSPGRARGDARGAFPGGGPGRRPAVPSGAGPRDNPAPDNFHPGSRGRNVDGPWNRDVIVYRVSGGGAAEKAAVFERAGVPTIARMKDGRLIAAHQHFPENDRENFDKVAARFSSDEGKTWTGPQVIRVTGLPDGMRFPFDPTLVALPDGRVRLYFTSLKGRRFEEDRPAIFSAISADGLSYTFEPGVRFGVEGRPVIDCAAVLHKGVFHLFAPDNGTQLRPGERPGHEEESARPRAGIGYHATSKDGLEFSRAEDVKISGDRRWLGNALSDGKEITFIGTGDPGAPGSGQRRGGVWMAVSKDGASWDPVGAPDVMGGDPGAVRSRDGGLVVVITGESRLRARGDTR